MDYADRDRRRTALALLVVLAAPLLLLAPCLLGERSFVPFDLAQFAPVKTVLTPAELAEVTRDQNTDVTEVPITFVPELRFARQELAEGRLPEWNPYARGGVPLLATAVVGLLYPPNWLYLLPSDPVDGLAAGAYVSFAIAGLLMLGFLRALGLGTAAAVFGALAFMFSGTLYANAHFYQRIAALIWLPGLLWAALPATDPASAARVPALLGFALCTAMTWLAGFPPYAAAVTLVAALFAAVRAVGLARAAGGAAAARATGLLALAGALGLGLAAIQLLPMFAFFPESNRSVDPTPAQLASDGFDPAGLLGLLMPDPFGHPHLTARLEYGYSPLALWLFTRSSWETGLLSFPANYNYIEYTVFPGTLVLLLAAAALSCRGAPLRGFGSACLALLVTLSFASGHLAWLHGLPGMRNVPPSRFIGPVCALVAALAAVGFERAWHGLGLKRSLALGAVAACLGGGLLWAAAWLRAHDAETVRGLLREDVHAAFRAGLPDLPISEVDKYVTPERVAAGRTLLLSNLLYAGLALLAAAAWVAALPWLRRRGRWLTAAMLIGGAATVVQLVVLAHGVSGGRVLEHPIETPVHAFLRAERDAAKDRGGFMVARGHALPELPFLLPPCTLVPEHIRDLNIYTFVDQHSHKVVARLWQDLPMSVLHKERWVKCLPDDERLGYPVLDLLGVRFVLSDRPLVHAGASVGPRWRGPHGDFFVYERPSPLPRAFVVPAVRALPDENAVLDALVAADLEPRAAALLTAADAAALPMTPEPDPRAAARSVRFERDTPNEIVLRIGAGPAGYLVLADTFLSGWTATVGGEPTPIARANVSMRVVPIPAGELEVRFAYDTPGLAAGAALSALSALALLALALASFRRRARRHQDPSLPELTSPGAPAPRS